MSVTAKPLYDYNRSFSANSQGPTSEPPPVPDEVIEPDAGRRLLGMPVGYPIGVPASPLTANARWIDACGQQGFNVLTYKTVRSSALPALPAPNWIFAEGLSEPQPVDAPPLVVHGNRDTRPADFSRYSMVNSFGIPSADPSSWQSDITTAVRALRAGQILIVSVVGAYESLDGQALIDDFAHVAKLAERAGAPAIELNLSCPNTVGATGRVARPICQVPDKTRDIVLAVRDVLASETKLVVKLSYLERNALEEVICPIADHVDGIAGINTLQVAVEDPAGGPAFCGTLDDPNGSRDRAGLSGIAIRDFALDFVRSLALLRRSNGWEFDILGMGGVMDAHDVRALMANGADAVQTATAASNNPALPRQLWTIGHPEPTLDERLVELLNAVLWDLRWDFRTVDGIARELNLDRATVQELLDRHTEVARRSVMNDKEGRSLYTAAGRPPTLRERLERVRWLLAR